MLAAIVGGLGFAFGSGCVEALVYDTLRERETEVSSRQLAEAMGAIEAAQRLANLLAFAAGGILVSGLARGDLVEERFVLAFVQAGVPPALFGLSLALASGLSVLGARYAYRLEVLVGLRWALLLAAGLPGALYVVMAAVLHPVWSVVAFCLLYSSMSLRGPILSGRMNVHIQSENRATVLSLVSMLSGAYVAPFLWRADRAALWAHCRPFGALCPGSDGDDGVGWRAALWEQARARIGRITWHSLMAWAYTWATCHGCPGRRRVRSARRISPVKKGEAA